MKNHRLSMLAMAIAAVALTGCEDDDNNRPGSVDITTAEAPFVAGAGAGLIGELGMIGELDDALPDMIPAGLGGIVSRARAAAAVDGEPVECEFSGTYVYAETASGWGIDYNNCVDIRQSEVAPEYEYYELETRNGTVLVSGVGSYGGYAADFDNYTWKRTESINGDVYETERRSIDGALTNSIDYGGYGGNIQDHYTSDGLKTSYSIDYYGNVPKKGPPLEDESYSISYDEIDVRVYYYAGYQFWNGFLRATDSENGAWTIQTDAYGFGVDYCDGDVTGTIIFAGRTSGELPLESFGGVHLVVTGYGDEYPDYSVRNADDSDSYSHQWFDYLKDYYGSCSS